MVSATLQQPTLVLNQAWQPVGIVTVARALIKVWNEAAYVIDPDTFQRHTWSDWSAHKPKAGESYISTSRSPLRVPEVITLTTYDRLPPHRVTFTRRNVFRRDRFTCQYCGIRPGSEELTIDHVMPRAQGGVSSWTNCVLACVTCNRTKANRTPVQAGMPLRKTPRRPLWVPWCDAGGVRIDSWSRFVSDAYWNMALDA